MSDARLILFSPSPSVLLGRSAIFGCEIAKRYTSHGFLGRYGTIVDVRSGLVNLTLTSEIFTGEGQLCSMLPEQAEHLAAQLLLCAKKLRIAEKGGLR